MLKVNHKILAGVLVFAVVAYLFVRRSKVTCDLCSCTEKMNYLPKKEGMAAIPPPQFKRIKNVERFVSRENTSPQYYSGEYKSYRDGSRIHEKFSNDFNTPQVQLMSRQATPESPFIGSL